LATGYRKENQNDVRGLEVRRLNDGSSTSWYLGNDVELKVAPATPSGLWIIDMGTGVKREGANTIVQAQDGQGSMRITFAAFGGAGTTQMHDYGPYGQPLTTLGLTLSSPKGYINERFDPETGLQYLHARYYDPLLGWYLGNDVELKVAPATPSGLWISDMGASVKREGQHHEGSSPELSRAEQVTA
jgi:RHS repeat-associated protein